MGGLIGILIIIVAVWLIVWAVRSAGRSTGESGGERRSPLDILKERYARGEIGDDEFEEKKRRLNS